MLRRLLRRLLPSSSSPSTPTRSSPPPSPSPRKEPEAAAAEAEEAEVEVDGEGVLALRSAGRSLLFLDIREPHEIRHGHVAGATLLPMNQVPERLAELPRDQTIIVYCAAGARSFGVAHYLREQGYPEAWSLIGGIGAWVAVDRAAWLPPPSRARFPPTTPVRLTEAAAARLGRSGAGTVQEVREVEGAGEGESGRLCYTLGVGGERIADLDESDLEAIGREPRR